MNKTKTQMLVFNYIDTVRMSHIYMEDSPSYKKSMEYMYECEENLRNHILREGKGNE